VTDVAARIVSFPVKHEQTEVEAHVRRVLEELSPDAELVDAVAARMKLFIDRFASHTFAPVFDLAVPPQMTQQQATALLRSIKKGVDAVVEQTERALCEIIIERLFLEVEIYRYKQDAANERPARPGGAKHRTGG
jgi:hypothetical protein